MEVIIKMKAYIIKIELEESNPLIWRRVIIPAGVTFNRLHDIIQNVTNFQSGYPNRDYHLFEFELIEESMVVTNDEQRYLEHHHYKRNKKMYKERLRTIPSDIMEFEKQHQERLKVEVRKPTGLKADDYLKKYKEVKYTYDFGVDWRFKVKLEETVDDYYFGFPTLLDGAETAPPEDVGGICGFYQFLEAYRNKNHGKHKETKAWAEALYFREYDPDWINNMLKGIKYKKTEWDKINHKGYQIIEDKYRKK